MSTPRYAVGQTISYALRIGTTAEKRVVAEIFDQKGHGYHVKVPGRQGLLFLRAGQIRPVGSTEPTEVVEEPAPTPTAGAVVREAEPPPAVVAATPDPIEAWLAQGRELLSTADALVSREEAAVAHADHEVDAAEQLLAATKATAQGARTRLRAAVERRAEIERRTGAAR